MKSELTYLRKTELFKELEKYQGTRFYAVVDIKVKNHLPEWIQKSAGVFWLTQPEGDKNLNCYSKAQEFFLTNGIQRTSQLVAIGGGATTDLAGFVAATILRGVSWLSIPTTLLGMIDASIGGKTGVNTPQGKNLVGAFHMPLKVIICEEFLPTLPKEEWISGKGEILKYGFLSEKIHQLILNRAPMGEIAYACANFKSDLIARDFTEQGERILLNLGHTLGHAFESSLQIPHGEAIALGLKYLFEVMKQNNFLLDLEIMMEALDLNPSDFNIKNYSQYNLESSLSFLKHDKKSVDSKIRLVLVKEIGHCFVQEISLTEFKEKIKAHVDLNH